MQQRLPDIERTLLSAYIDGELSPAERKDVERLLESSDGARAYLRDLRAVNSIAGDAFPALPAGLASAGVMAGGKLTGAAIRSAATKGAIGKGGLSGGWGLAGLATAAAVVVAVGASLLGGPSAEPVERTARATPEVQAPVVAPRPLPVANVDSASFIIPAMTQAELIDFAFEGTLPLDAGRNRYITVTQEGESALGVCMHAAEPNRQERIEGLASSVGSGRLDSVHQIVRTALIPYANNSVAIRSDLPMIRLQVLEELSESMPSMPAEVRETFERVRIELRDAGREVERARGTMMIGREAGGVAAGGRDIATRTVLYIPVESEGMKRLTLGELAQAPDRQMFSLVYNRCGVVAVDPGMLEAASSAAFTTVVPDRRRIETRVVAAGDPTAGAPMISRKKGVNQSPANEPPALNDHQPLPPAPPRSPNSNTRHPVTQEELDDLLKNAEKSLRNARESLRRADDIQKSQGGGGNVPDEAPERDPEDE